MPRDTAMLPREWFSAAQLAELALPGMPTTKGKILEMAKRLQWQRLDWENTHWRARTGQGGGIEFHLAVLPMVARAKLAYAEHQAASAPPETSAAEGLWDWFARQPTTKKAKAEARLKALAAVETLVTCGERRVGTDIILLDREVRVAAKVHALATYPSSNRTTLSGSSQWSDTSSNPVDAILAAMDIPMAKPNVGVIGNAAFTKLRQHPKLVSSVLGNAGTAGAVTAEAIAAFFGLDKLLVGEGWLNTARPGQAAAMSRVWGKHLALIYLDPNGGPMDMPSFGWTAEWGTRQVSAIPDKHMGARGSEWIRSFESVDEQISASDMGFLFRDCVA